MDKKLNRMKELIEKINHASVQYYQYDNSIMTNFEWDALYDELVELEKTTNTVLSNSPTIKIETKILSSLEQEEHPAPMLSLDKTKDISDLETFLESATGILSWKLDGITLVLTYEKGKLMKALTRGNGTVGEVVTENARNFENIPLTIPYKDTLVIRGEAVIKYSDFNKLNEDIEEENKYKNPRNLCSGSVRQLDSKITATRSVNFIAFALIVATKKFKLKSESFKWLAELGFEVADYEKVNNQNIEKIVTMFRERVKTYDIPSDGLVLTYDDIEYSVSLGKTAKHPKDSIAFKWEDELAETTLLDIDWSVSRTGLINPVAVFKSVELEGTTVSRASLHNLSIMDSLELGIGDTILVYKANMIIPQIAENNTRSNNINIPNTCPECGKATKISVNNDIKYLYCTNEFCRAKLLKKLSLFVSRNAMNIDGLSDAILSKLISEEIIKTYSDLYKIEKYRETIIKFEGFGELSYSNLINAINESRKTKLANFIYALGIPGIGLSRAKTICNQFNNDYEVIKELTYDELIPINDIGEILAEDWVKWFTNKQFISELDNLLKEIEFIDEKSNINKVLEGYTFVITGSVVSFKNRDELIQHIEDLGGKVVGSMSSKVDYLINNDETSMSTKNKKAHELGIKIISEEELLKITNN